LGNYIEPKPLDLETAVTILTKQQTRKLQLKLTQLGYYNFLIEKKFFFNDISDLDRRSKSIKETVTALKAYNKKNLNCAPLSRRKNVDNLITTVLKLNLSVTKRRFHRGRGNRDQNIQKLLEVKECQNCNLRDGELSKANLKDADLREAKLNGANLEKADLSGADLRDADLSKADLRGANLTNADLRGTNLIYADLSGANLSRADLREADLWGADLRGANLSGADLEGANLTNKNLRGANLRAASLSGADLSGAELKGADLRSIGLSDAIFCNTSTDQGINDSDCCLNN